MRPRLGLLLAALVATPLIRPVGEGADDLTDDEVEDIKARQRRVFEEDQAYAIERGYLPGGAPSPQPDAGVPVTEKR